MIYLKPITLDLPVAKSERKSEPFLHLADVGAFIVTKHLVAQL